MKIIAVAMQKGGVGKSTLTRSLAVAASNAGLMTLVLDMDPQQTVDYWGRRRPSGSEPAVRFVTANDLAQTVAIARAHGCDLILIDTPPARSSEGPAAIDLADLVLIPCSPTVEAFEQLSLTGRVARGFGKPAAVVLNLVTPNSRAEIETGRAVCEGQGLRMAPAVLTRRKIHVEGSQAGKTAQEIANISPGAQEVLALWRWVAAELGVSQVGDDQVLRRA